MKRNNSPKLILSRKGFDSGTGGSPSPIEGKNLYPIPIPQAGSGVFYKDICWSEKVDYLSQMQQLGISFYSEAHLDPDIQAAWLSERSSGWRAAFGQTGAAASHLQGREVGKGDLFLFFGWFRKAERNENGRLRYTRGTPDQHIIYGYLEVGEVLDLRKGGVPDWAKKHPHYVFRESYNPQGNFLYIAAAHSSFWPGKEGAGTFVVSGKRILSESGGKRSIWRLPSCFFKGGYCRLSYHEKRKGTSIKGTNGKWKTIQSVARGQEFVCDINPGIRDWLKMIGQG